MDKSEKFWGKSANTYDQEERKDEQTHNKIIKRTKEYLKMSDGEVRILVPGDRIADARELLGPDCDTADEPQE